MKEEKKYTFEDLPPMSEEESLWWKEHNDEYYHYLYRIDNKLNGKYYYGIHSEIKDNTLREDSYMGSGVDLLKDQKRYGIDNFEKTIIKIFSTRDEARLEEFIVVSEELVKDPMCYNKVVGGGTLFITSDLVVVNYKDENLRKDHFFLVTTNEYNKNKDKYITPTSNSVNVKLKDDKNGNFFLVSTEEYHNNKDKYITAASNKGIFKDKDNYSDVRMLGLNDPLVLSGQFIGVSKGIRRDEKFRQSITGENNGMYGSFWITNGKENKKTKDKNIPEGWWKGSTIDDPKIKCINKYTLEEKYIKKSLIDFDNWYPYIFFKNNKLITKELLISVSNTCETWIEVAEKLNISVEVVKRMRKYYNITAENLKRVD